MWFLSIILLSAVYMIIVIKEDARRAEELRQKELDERNYRRKKDWTW